MVAVVMDGIIFPPRHDTNQHTTELTNPLDRKPAHRTGASSKSPVMIINGNTIIARACQPRGGGQLYIYDHTQIQSAPTHISSKARTEMTRVLMSNFRIHKNISPSDHRETAGGTVQNLWQTITRVISAQYPRKPIYGLFMMLAALLIAVTSSP